MTLDLINPLGNNFLKDFPGQNAVNLDQIDAQAGPCLATHPLRSFVPTLRATTTDPGLGTTGAVNIAYYYRIWDHVYCWGYFLFGSGFTTGIGTYYLEMPFEWDTTQGSGISTSPVVGQGWIQDASSAAGRVPITVHQRETNRLMFGVALGALSVNRDVREAGSPITWAQGDGIIWNASFKVKET